MEGGAFVVHEHHARRLHYDFRLEREGVLKSWAVPKGLPEEPGEKRLAIEVEDHPLEYGEFEGTIPEGQYGAGTVKIWDKGSYEPIVWNENMIEIFVKGDRLHGRYVLTRFKKAGEKQWLILKAKDKDG
jgi:bifunctional non-homologous end joining protein LigD